MTKRITKTVTPVVVPVVVPKKMGSKKAIDIPAIDYKSMMLSAIQGNICTNSLVNYIKVETGKKQSDVVKVFVDSGLIAKPYAKLVDGTISNKSAELAAWIKLNLKDALVIASDGTNKEVGKLASSTAYRMIAAYIRYELKATKTVREGKKGLGKVQNVKPIVYNASQVNNALAFFSGLLGK